MSDRSHIALNFTFIHLQKELIIVEPRQRRQTNRYGNDETVMEISDLESTSGSDNEKDGSATTKQSKKSKKQKKTKEEDDEDYANDVPGDKYDRAECFKVEKLLLVYG